MIAANTLLDERYRIIELLGTGAMGSVYLALDERLSSNVAVKGTIFKRFNFAPEAEIKLRRAFEREAKLLANLQHESIPRVSDYFTHDGEQYLVMEFISGDDLFEQAEKLRRRGEKFDVVTISDWALQLLEALHYLHTQSEPVIHKDIKLSNLKVNVRNRIKLLDFGISKGFAGEMTRIEAGSLQMGTEEYAPLEQYLKFPSRAAETLRQALSIKHAEKVAQILAQNTDASSDLYSLAVTVYRLLTDKQPADYLPRALAVWEGASDPLIPPHEINPAVPVSVSKVLLHALALDKTERPQSAAAMRGEFQAAWQEHQNREREDLQSVESIQKAREREEVRREVAVDFEQALADEIARREIVETALVEREKELELTLARSRQATESSFHEQHDTTQTANVSAVKTVPKNSSLFAKLLGKKYLGLILLLLILISSVAFTLSVDRSRVNNEQQFQQHLTRGSELLANKSYDAAITEFSEAVKLKANSAEAFANRGEAFRKKQDLDAAFADYSQAAALDPSNVFALTSRADIYCQKQDYPNALADFAKAARVKPDYAYLYEKRGYCFENQNNFADALNDYNRALDLHGGEAWTLFRRGVVHLRRAENEAAVVDFTAVLERTPEDWASFGNRAAAYQRLGKSNLARKDLKRLEELQSK